MFTKFQCDHEHYSNSHLTHGDEFQDGEIVEKVFKTHPEFSVIAESHIQLRFRWFVQDLPLWTEGGGEGGGGGGGGGRGSRIRWSILWSTN